MKTTNQIIVILCLLIVTAFSYATSAEKDKSIDSSPINKVVPGHGVGLPPTVGSLVTCIHQRSWLTKRNGRQYSPIYVYAYINSLEPCPKFSLEFEHPDNIASIRNVHEIEWGVYSEPVFEPAIHEHCDLTPNIKQICDSDGHCTLSPGCTDYDVLTNPYVGTTTSSIGASKTNFGVINPNTIKPIAINRRSGSTKEVHQGDHCDVGHGNAF